MQKSLPGREKELYLREIKRDIAYFSRSFRRAHASVEITGCSPAEASRRVRRIDASHVVRDIRRGATDLRSSTTAEYDPGW